MLSTVLYTELLELNVNFRINGYSSIRNAFERAENERGEINNHKMG